MHHSDGANYDATVSFISHRVWGQELPLSQGTVMAVIQGDELAAACLFHNYQPDCGVMELSAASRGGYGLTRFALRELFGYVFDQMKCQAAVMRVDARNERMCQIASRIGFARHDIPRLRGRDVAEAVFVLGDDEWRRCKFYKGGA
jgi:RimJ/RimL family protein N-acetyltransferase